MNNGMFAGKVVLVTGAGSGIGEAALKLFLDGGATVFGMSRRKETLEAGRTRHPKARWLLADVANSAAVKSAVEGLVREAGRLDVLVNNAGQFIFAPLEQATEESLRAQFEANVYGTVFVTQAALPALKQSKGTIINIGSAAGHKPAPNGSIYGATKAAIESLTRSWALELAPAGIRVNAIAPGPTETRGFEQIAPTAEGRAAMKAAFTSQVPLGRMASTEEVGHWIIALADPNVTWMTGQIISIDGGMSLT